MIEVIAKTFNIEFAVQLEYNRYGLYTKLLKLQGESKGFFITNLKWLLVKTKMCPRTIKKYLQELNEKGLIYMETDYDNIREQYTNNIMYVYPLIKIKGNVLSEKEQTFYDKLVLLQGGGERFYVKNIYQIAVKTGSNYPSASKWLDLLVAKELIHYYRVHDIRNPHYNCFCVSINKEKETNMNLNLF